MSDYKIKLEVFEGPLDLLLHLIKEEELNIYDIPISRITAQYFEYLEMMKQFNMEIAGEFLVMAATLIYIKSRMLLPSPPTAEEDELAGVDPREELVRRLIEYRKYKEIASTLREKEMEQSHSFSRGTVMELNLEDPDYLQEISVFQLLAAFRKMLKDSGAGALYEVTLEDISVTERMNEIMELLETEPRVQFENLFANRRGRMELIGTFLAILELMKQQLIRVFQEGDLKTIWIQRIEETDDLLDEEPSEDREPEAAPAPSAYAFREEDLPGDEDDILAEEEALHRAAPEPSAPIPAETAHQPHTTGDEPATDNESGPSTPEPEQGKEQEIGTRDRA